MPIPSLQLRRRCWYLQRKDDSHRANHSCGGSVSRLYFAVVGDTRPAFIDQLNGYPKEVITKLYSDLTAVEANADVRALHGGLRLQLP